MLVNRLIWKAYGQRTWLKVEIFAFKVGREFQRWHTSEFIYSFKVVSDTFICSKKEYEIKLNEVWRTFKMYQSVLNIQPDLVWPTNVDKPKLEWLHFDIFIESKFVLWEVFTQPFHLLLCQHIPDTLLHLFYVLTHLIYVPKLDFKRWKTGFSEIFSHNHCLGHLVITACNKMAFSEQATTGRGTWSRLWMSILLFLSHIINLHDL